MKKVPGDLVRWWNPPEKGGRFPSLGVVIARYPSLAIVLWSCTGGVSRCHPADICLFDEENQWNQ